MNLAINGGEPLRKSFYPQWPVFDEKEVRDLKRNSKNWKFINKFK